jgi:hypothetical protein
MEMKSARLTSTPGRASEQLKAGSLRVLPMSPLNVCVILRPGVLIYLANLPLRMQVYAWSKWESESKRVAGLDDAKHDDECGGEGMLSHRCTQGS